jgi:bifunctional non-homologous end joining protein LigD
VVDAQGHSSFQKLQRSMGKGVTAGFVFEVFDLIYLDGFNLTKTPLRERKLLLKDLFKSTGSRGTLRYSEHLQGNGDAFFRHACEYRIEGIVSKLADSPYDSTRNRSWLKVKCNKQQEFVIAGYTPSSRGLPGFGSLVLGVYEKDKLVYAGRVGTGFTLKLRRELQKQLDKLSRKTSPFAVVPKGPGLRAAHWMEPKLIAEVAFIEWTSDGSIRHPSFQGLREDKDPKEVVREMPKLQSAHRDRKARHSLRRRRKIVNECAAATQFDLAAAQSSMACLLHSFLSWSHATTSLRARTFR